MLLYRSSKEWKSTLETAKLEVAQIDLRLKQLIDEILNYDLLKDMPIVHQHVAKMLPYTVIGGKMTRGAAVVTSVERILNQPLTPKQLMDARTLGAVIEFLQAHFLVADDIMDCSITRRGEPCWYKVGDNGLGALNDSLILNSLSYTLLDQHFTHHPCYRELCQLLSRIILLTDLGQSADTLVSNRTQDGSIVWSRYTLKNYFDIVKHKTAYYTTVLPVRLALYYCKYTDTQVHEKAENILIRIGNFFQVQDDYFDCYKNSQTLGKVGTDIENGKCTWLITTALSIASSDQVDELKKNYGKNNSTAIETVKSIYNQLNIPQLYSQLEKQKYTEIINLVDEWDEVETSIPRGLFIAILAPLYERSK